MNDPAETPLPAPLPAPADPHRSPYKNNGGAARVIAATRHSLAGLRAAFRHESAFRQELAVGVPMLLAAPFVAQSREQALLLAGSVVAVWVVELLNSALEAVADAVSLQQHPLLGRAKDMASAAVFLSLLFAGLTWLLLLWPQ